MNISFPSNRLEHCKVFSFDIFDTLLTRFCAKPVDIFSEVEERLISEDTIWRNFAEQRQAVEFNLRKELNFGREIKFSEIYASLRINMGLNLLQMQQVMDLELKLESEFIFPIAETCDWLVHLRQLGKKVLFISDIYLPKPFIYQLLDRYQLILPEDSLYVSSEHGHLKSEGSLFKIVQEKENILYNQWCHIGDNPESDQRIPASFGISTYLFTRTTLTRYEKLIIDSNDYTPKFCGLIAGILRQQRLSFSPPNEKQRTIWETSCNVSGPLMVGFVAWCIEEAQKAGLKRLYFLARDGQVLKKIAQQLNMSQSRDLSFHYLEVSRQALLFPALEAIDDEALEWILAPTATLTLKMVLQRINCTFLELCNSLKNHGFSEQRCDRQLTSDECQKLTVCLKEESCASYILRKAALYRDNTFGYLSQAGLLKDESYALVDIGWNGTLQRSISRILSLHGINYPIKGYYFGIRNRKLFKKNDEMSAYFTDYRKPHPLDKISYIVPLAELFVVADHGGIISYEKNGSSYSPVLRIVPDHPVLTWGVKLQQQGMVACATAISSNSIDIREFFAASFLQSNFARFVLNPSVDEALVYGSFPDAEDQNESYFVPLARSYSLIELVKHRLYRFRHHHNEWAQAALCISSPFLVKFLGLVTDPLSLPLSIDYVNTVYNDDEVSLGEGFGPVEGPYPDLHLGEIIWASGLIAKLKVHCEKLDFSGPFRMEIEVQNVILDQLVSVFYNNLEIDSFTVPTNFSNPKASFYLKTIGPFEPCNGSSCDIEFHFKGHDTGETDTKMNLALLFAKIQIVEEKEIQVNEHCNC